MVLKLLKFSLYTVDLRFIYVENINFKKLKLILLADSYWIAPPRIKLYTDSLFIGLYRCQDVGSEMFGLNCLLRV